MSEANSGRGPFYRELAVFKVQHGLTDREIGDRFEPAIRQPAISRYRNGISVPTESRRPGFLDLLGISDDSIDTPAWFWVSKANFDKHLALMLMGATDLPVVSPLPSELQIGTDLVRSLKSINEGFMGDPDFAEEFGDDVKALSRLASHFLVSGTGIEITVNEA